MAERRMSIGPLAQLFSKAAQPVYAVDAKRRLVWCNEAFLEFFGISWQAVVGQECRWTSPGLQPEELPAADHVLTAVCPSPEVFAGDTTTGRICWKDAAGQWRTYRVEYLRLSDAAGNPLVTVGVIGSEIASDAAADAAREIAASTPQIWHERLRQLLLEEAARHRVEQLVGTSAAIQRARRQVLAAAQTKAPVLVVGPAGSGRRFVAQAIHYHSPDGSRSSCITLACQVLGAEVVLSTLVAALRFRPGPGELPVGTVVLLDAETLPAAVQGQIAKEFHAAGSALRLIATSNVLLLPLAEQGLADPQFASLLSTLIIELPPLARRPDDIPLLAQHFLEEINRESDKQLAGFSAEALDRLVAYPWPGNVAELRNMVLQAHRAATGPVITVDDLPERIYFAIQAASHPPAKDEAIQLGPFLREIQRELVDRALRRAGGNKAKAARLLGISRPRLLRLLEEFLEQPASRPSRRKPRPPTPRLRLPPLPEETTPPEEETPTFEELSDANDLLPPPEAE